MRPFTLITLILVFFFLARHIRIFVSVVTGSFPAGVVVIDTVIVGLILFYMTYSLGVLSHNGPRLDRVKLFLLAILALAFLQSFYFAIQFHELSESGLLRAFYSFREFFMPLSLLFLFSYLIKNEIAKSRDSIFKRLSTLFTIFLWVAIGYNFLEWTLRTTVPEFDSFYLEYYVQYVSKPIESIRDPVSDHEIAVISRLTGLSIKRVYGIGLDLYVSGGVIFLCYLFHVFMSGKFRVFSILNCLVFVALLLAGSLTFLAPFFVLNAVIFARRYARKNFLAPILVGIILAGGIMLLVRAMSPTFTTEGYFVYLIGFANPLKQNLGLFIFGNGPTSVPLANSGISVGELQYSLFYLARDIGFFRIFLEAGLIMSALFVLFHIIVFKGNGNISARRQLPDRYIKGLKIIIVLGMVVSVVHLPILFDRTIMVFHILFVALLYNWSKFRKTSHKPAPAGPALAQLGAAILG